MSSKVIWRPKLPRYRQTSGLCPRCSSGRRISSGPLHPEDILTTPPAHALSQPSDDRLLNRFYRFRTDLAPYWRLAIVGYFKGTRQFSKHLRLAQLGKGKGLPADSPGNGKVGAGYRGQTWSGQN